MANAENKAVVKSELNDIIKVIWSLEGVGITMMGTRYSDCVFKVSVINFFGHLKLFVTFFKNSTTSSYGLTAFFTGAQIILNETPNVVLSLINAFKTYSLQYGNSNVNHGELLLLAPIYIESYHMDSNDEYVVARGEGNVSLKSYYEDYDSPYGYVELRFDVQTGWENVGSIDTYKEGYMFAATTDYQRGVFAL